MLNQLDGVQIRNFDTDHLDRSNPGGTFILGFRSLVRCLIYAGPCGDHDANCPLNDWLFHSSKNLSRFMPDWRIHRHCVWLAPCIRRIWSTYSSSPVTRPVRLYTRLSI